MRKAQLLTGTRSLAEAKACGFSAKACGYWAVWQKSQLLDPTPDSYDHRKRSDLQVCGKHHVYMGSSPHMHIRKSLRPHYGKWQKSQLLKCTPEIYTSE
jgi:hypothetical protein